jgi:hypothetical protein
MRAKDLEAGAEYLWSNTHQWAEGGYARTARVRVEDTQTVYVSRNFRDDVVATKPVKPGDYLYSKAVVKTVYLDEQTGEVLQGGEWFYARPTDLRGPWAEADAKRKAARQVKLNEAHAEQQQRQAAEDRADGLRERALDLGLVVQPRKVGNYRYELYEVELTKLLDRLEGLKGLAAVWSQTPSHSAYGKTLTERLG